MKACFVKTLWGVPEASDPSEWDSLLARVKADGFDAVEFSQIVMNDSLYAKHADKWKTLTTKHDLRYIAQIQTCLYVPRSGNGIVPEFGAQTYTGGADVDAHIESFCSLLDRAKSLGAVLLNSHSGHDSWDLNDGVKFFIAAVAAERKAGLSCVHETHRRRLLWNPWQARELLKRVPGLKVNADLSHWVVVAERIFDENTDADWPALLDLVANRCGLIHARVGYAEGPQVHDPSAPEYSYELASHEKWWAAIWKAQQKRGFEVCYIEPEFGPEPYLHTVPHTRARMTDLWAINTWMGARLAKSFSEKYGWTSRFAAQPERLTLLVGGGDSDGVASQDDDDRPATASRGALSGPQGVLLGAASTAAVFLAVTLAMKRK